MRDFKDDLYPWLWQRRPFTLIDLAQSKYVGFVYQIHNTINGMTYLGMKNFFFKRGGKKVMSDWIQYWGSSKYLAEDIDKYGKENFVREIKSLHTTKLGMRYSELELIVMNKAIESDKYYNRSLNARYQRLNRTADCFDTT